MWPDHRIQNLLGIELPIIQAPMAGAVSSEMVIAVSDAGGLGSLPCAMLTPEQVRTELGIIRQRTSQPINLNFFCHRPPRDDPARMAVWKRRLEPYYVELGLDPNAPRPLRPALRLTARCATSWRSSRPRSSASTSACPRKGFWSGSEPLARKSCARPRRWMRRAGWRRRAVMLLSHKAQRRAAIVACS